MNSQRSPRPPVNGVRLVAAGAIIALLAAWAGCSAAGSSTAHGGGSGGGTTGISSHHTGSSSSGTGGHAGSGGSTTGTTGGGGTGGGCSATQKTCNGACVEIDDPSFGCDPTSCVACPSFPNAAPTCSGGACALGACNGTFKNCDGDPTNGCEVDPQTDPQQCGACGAPCVVPNATASCVAGQCAVGTCDTSKSDCDGDPLNGCESDTQSDPLNCGACQHACAPGEACQAGMCGVFCPAGSANCNLDPADGCEVTLGTTTDCAFCGNSCNLANATGLCDSTGATAVCSIASCDTGFTDCDNNPANGCETHTGGSAADCGTCGHVCPSGPHSTAVCTTGACSIACDPGFGDCDNDPSNGCEVDLNNTPGNCGACNKACVIANGTGGCAAGSCTVAMCNVGFADCNGMVADGCEVNTNTSANNCGTCGTVCMIAGGNAACAGGKCTVASCNTGTADCNGNPADGCEVDTNTSVTNCGTCGNVCVAANGTPTCTSGACAVANCNAGFGDCNNSPSDGCETNLATTAANCGMCGSACAAANGVPGCQASACTVASCNAGFGDCNGLVSDGCEVDTNSSVANCGNCGHACITANGTPGCTAGACTTAGCNVGFGDCNNSPSDGCETNTNTNVNNCGMCGTVCSIANGTAGCTSGACAVASCTAPFKDCNNSPSDGCEINTNTNVNNCGNCGAVCNVPNASPACTGGTCQVSSCNTGFADCNGAPADGCEINTKTDPGHCGSCSTVCALPNATPGCTNSACVIASCNTGFANCNNITSDGCEVNTNTNVNNCGTCGTKCTTANGTAGCVGGSCSTAGCNTGFADCNNNPSDGCEINKNTDPANCGTCGKVCNVPNATAGCSAGVCTVGSCKLGFKDCNLLASDGCEINTLSDVNNCGACGNKCVVANGTAACVNGACVVAACNPLFGDCDGLATTGCETALNTVAHCGACVSTCTTQNGSPACNVNGTTATCGVASCSAGYANCPGDGTNCSTFTAGSDVNNCGGCGVKCTTANGTPKCTAGVCGIASCNAGWAHCAPTGTNCEDNIANDSNNCGACGNVCLAACGGAANHVTSASCSSSACHVNTGGCASGWDDHDLTCSDGCECKFSTTAIDCGSAISLGSWLPGQSASPFTSNLYPASPNGAWFVVSFGGNTSLTFHPKITLTDPLNEFVMDVVTDCATQAKLTTCTDNGANSSTGVTAWETSYTGPIPGADPSSYPVTGSHFQPIPLPGGGTVHIRVYRKNPAALPNCNNAYTINVSD